MKVSKDKVVSVTYILETNNVEGKKVLVEQVDVTSPMAFIYGTGGLIEKFESELANMTSGDSFEFMIESEEAYGPYDDEAIVRLPLDVFKIDGEFPKDQFLPGTIVPMSDQDGNLLRGKILDVTDIDVQVDFNHPLAGQDLFFKGNVVEVREATADELAHGHVHGPGGHHH